MSNGRPTSQEIRKICDRLVEACSDDEDLDTCYECLEELQTAGQLGLAALLRLTKHPVGDVRLHAVEALGNMGALSAAPLLEQILETDSDTDVQGAAAKALSQLQSGGAVTRLLSALKTTDRGKRSDTIVALARLRASEAAPRLLELADRLREIRDPAAGVPRAAAAYIEQGLKGLVSLLAVPAGDADMRRGAVALLGQVGHLEAIQIVTVTLSDPDENFRAAALRSLGNLVLEFRPLPEPLKAEVKQALFRILNEDESGRCRQLAVLWLGGLYDPDVLPTLRATAADDPDRLVREQAKESIKSLQQIVRRQA